MSKGIASYCTLERLQKRNPIAFIEELLHDGFHWDKIVSITESESEVLDFVIPSTHSFTTNGFISHNTPRGKNHGYDLYLMAKDNPEWFCQVLTVRETFGHGGTVGEADVAAERAAGMSENLIEQEYYCSFDAAVENAVLGEQIIRARADGRITSVPYQSGLPVDTYWDIGRDGTAIWFVQALRNEVRIIDYFESFQSELALDLAELQKKAYVFGNTWFPHDADFKDYKTGKTPKEVAASLGFSVDIVDKVAKSTQIDAARALFNRCWFDEKKCHEGLNKLSSWCFGWDEKMRLLSTVPIHNWASHSGDAFCQVALKHEDQIVWTPPDRYAKKKKRHTSPWAA